jgi:aminopeptidase N
MRLAFLLLLLPVPALAFPSPAELRSDAAPRLLRDRLKGHGAATAARGWADVVPMGWDVLHMEVALDIDRAEERLSGSTTITLARTTGGAVRLHGPDPVDQILQDGLPAEPDRDGAVILLPDPGIATTTVSARWTVYGGNAELGLQWDPDLLWVWDETDGARRWLVAFDEPWDKSTATFHVTVDTGETVAMNGTLVGVEDSGGRQTWTWDIDFPIPTYLIGLHVGHLAQATDPGAVPIHTWATPDTLDTAVAQLDQTRETMGIFAERWGAYPWDSYGNVIVPGLSSAMEHTTCTTFGGGFGAEDWDWVDAHELAHQWFGDLVTCSTFADLWLNEGFASYAEAVWYEAQYGPEGLTDYMRWTAASYFDWRWQEGVFPLWNPEYLWGGTVYDKGSWVVHMLRGVLGEDVFWDGVRHYLDVHYGGVASTDDLQARMEEVAGEDLSWFFDPWVRAAGEPLWSWGVTQTERGGTIQLDVEVDQDRPEFRMPVVLRVGTLSGVRDLPLLVEGAGARASFCLEDAPISLELDPDHWILLAERPGSPGLASSASWVCGDAEPMPEEPTPEDPTPDLTPGSLSGNGCACGGGTKGPSPATVLAMVVVLVGALRPRCGASGVRRAKVSPHAPGARRPVSLRR